MSSMPKKTKISEGRTERRRSSRRRPHSHARSRRVQRSICNGGFVTSSNKVSDKLEALKNLIPAAHNGDIVKADQLFQETADYIVLLRTQVVVLQGLIEIYGSSSTERGNDAVL